MSKGSDVLDRIAKFNRGRDPERLALKYRAMQNDALAFFRGTCHLFCTDWPNSGVIGNAPVVWVCGDLHVENFGTYKGDNRLVYFDIADFDEAVLAPCDWELARLATSVLIAARVHDLKRKRAAAFVNELLDSYRAALIDGKARWIERSLARGLIGRVMEGLEHRGRKLFVAKRIERRAGKVKLRVDGRHTLTAQGAARQEIKRFMRAFSNDKSNPAFFKYVDAARRIAGTGSLGLERYTILINGRGPPDGFFLLDLKLAVPSALAKYINVRQPEWRSEAARIVSIERRMQAISPALLHAVSFDSRAFVLRELMPSQDKLDLTAWRTAEVELSFLARDLGFVLAWSELRSGGRDGSATIDELIAFANESRWRRSIAEFADDYQDTAWTDWKRFRAAYREGHFEVSAYSLHFAHLSAATHS